MRNGEFPLNFIRLEESSVNSLRLENVKLDFNLIDLKNSKNLIANENQTYEINASNLIKLEFTLTNQTGKFYFIYHSH